MGNVSLDFESVPQVLDFQGNPHAPNLMLGMYI